MLRVRVVWSGVAGTPWYTNHYFAGTSEVTAFQAKAAVQETYDTIQDVISTSLQVTVLSDVYSIDPATGEIVTVFTAGVDATYAGAAAGDLLPIGTCARVKYTTGVYQDGRQVQGSTFIGGMVETNSTAQGQVSAALGGELQAAFDLMSTGTPIMDIWSRPRPARGGDKPLPARAGAAYPVKGVSVPPDWSFLRSHRD